MSSHGGPASRELTGKFERVRPFVPAQLYPRATGSTEGLAICPHPVECDVAAVAQVACVVEGCRQLAWNLMCFGPQAEASQGSFDESILRVNGRFAEDNLATTE